MIALFIFLIIIPVQAWAMTEPEFQSRAVLLKKAQTKTDALLKSLGVSSESEAAPKSSGRDQESGSLFRVHGDLSRLQLPVGKLLYGRILNRLVVGADGSPVLIVLDSGQKELSGLRLMGIARQAGTAGRMALEVSRLLLRTGRSLNVQAVGLDPAGSYGLEAQVFSSKALAVAGAMTSSFISGYAASQQTQVANPFGFSTAQPTSRNALLQGVAQTAADQSKRLIDEATAEKPVLVVEAETPVVVLVQEEVRF